MQVIKLKRVQFYLVWQSISSGPNGTRAAIWNLFDLNGTEFWLESLETTVWTGLILAKLVKKEAYSKITGWSSWILSRGKPVVSTFVFCDTQTSAQVRAEPTVRTCNPKSPGHPVVFEFTKTPSLPPTLNICPLTENKGGNQSWYRCWEDVQSSATNVKHERRAIEIRPEKLCLFKLLPEKANTPWCFLSVLTSFSLLPKMNITLFYPK